MKKNLELLLLVLILSIFPMSLLFLATHQHELVQGIEKVIKTGGINEIN